MKKHWKWIVIGVGVLGVITCICVSLNWLKLGEATQVASIFIALIATLVAISASDPKINEVKVEVEKRYKKDSFGIKKEEEIFDKELLKEIECPLKTLEVHF